MRKKRFIARAQIVQPGLAIGGLYKAILRAASVAGETNRTFLAIAWESVAFGEAEAALFGRACEIGKWYHLHIA